MYRTMRLCMGAGGWVLVKDFKSAISTIPDGLSMTQRKVFSIYSL